MWVYANYKILGARQKRWHNNDTRKELEYFERRHAPNWEILLTRRTRPFPHQPEVSSLPQTTAAEFQLIETVGFCGRCGSGMASAELDDVSYRSCKPQNADDTQVSSKHQRRKRSILLLLWPGQAGGLIIIYTSCLLCALEPFATENDHRPLSNSSIAL